MKIIIILTVLLNVVQCWAQEEVKPEKEIRRTIGISSSILSNLHSPGKTSFSYIQRSLEYRQCWKSYIFSSKLSIMKQENAPMNYFSSGDFAYINDSFFCKR